MVDGVIYFRIFHRDLSRLAAPIDEYIWDVVLTSQPCLELGLSFTSALALDM